MNETQALDIVGEITMSCYTRAGEISELERVRDRIEPVIQAASIALGGMPYRETRGPIGEALREVIDELEPPARRIADRLRQLRLAERIDEAREGV